MEKQKKLTPLNAWAFSFACAIGWAAYIMPATTFLPRGGINGSILAFLMGGLVMCVIALCYHYLGNLYPAQGGIYNLIKSSMGRAHRSHRWGHRFESCCDHQPGKVLRNQGFFFFLLSPGEGAFSRADRVQFSM
ncbi:MAG: APC family permease [Clostridia bacterium]|nr:APC family permease [Clostridia bacterium]